MLRYAQHDNRGFSVTQPFGNALTRHYAQHDNRGFSVTVGSVTVGDDSQMEGKLHDGRDNPTAERRCLAE